MSTSASRTDSNLSGQPSDDIDKQKGPSIGSNAESAGSTLNAGKVTTGAGQGSTENTNQSGQQKQPGGTQQ